MQKLIYHQPTYTFQIDFSRHVGNLVYIEWMEMGRVKLLAEVGLAVHEVATTGIVPVLMETHIQYKKQLFMGDTVTIELWLSELRGASASLEFRFLNQDGELVATGRQRGLFIRLDSGRPVRLSPDQRARFEQFLLPGETA